MRTRSAAIAGLWLFAAACGGNEGRSQTARTEAPSMGGEMASSGAGAPSQQMVAAGTPAGVSTGARTPIGDTRMGAGASTGVGAGASVGGTGVSGELGGSGSLAQGGASGSAGAMGRDLGGSTGMPGSEMEGEMGMEGMPGMEGGMQQGMQEGMEHGGGMAQRPEQRGTEGERSAQAARNEVCPAGLEGLNVRATQIPRGGALVLTASRDDVDELRARMHRLANLHQAQHGAMGGGEGAPGATQGRTEPGARTEARPSGGSAARGATGEEVGAQGEHMGREEHVQFVDTEALIHQASEIRVIEIPRGARVEVRFDDATKVRDLRGELREDAEMLRNGQCPLSFQTES